jgi:hypothetical protein
MDSVAKIDSGDAAAVPPPVPESMYPTTLADKVRADKKAREEKKASLKARRALRRP